MVKINKYPKGKKAYCISHINKGTDNAINNTK